MKIIQPKELTWEIPDGITNLKGNNHAELCLQGNMKETKPIVLGMKIPNIDCVLYHLALTDGNEILFGSSDMQNLILLNLRSFTCHQFDTEEIKNARWPDRIGIKEGAMHSGLIILSAPKNGEPKLHSFSTKDGLKSISSPILPKGFCPETISIDKRYIYIAGCSEASMYPWEIHVWNRETLDKITQLTCPVLLEDMHDVGDEIIQHMVIQEDLLFAVTSTGRLFYWNKFQLLQDRRVSLTDNQIYGERFIDTLYLDRDSDRVVMMALVCGSEAAMVLDSKLTLVPADCSVPHNYYLRITTDCQTVIRIDKPYSSHQGNKTPQLDVYSLSDSEPSFTVKPLSDSLNSELGNFVDIWANKYSLIYFGVDGIVQVRFDNSYKETDVNDEAVTSSHYISVNYQDSR